MKSLIIQSIRLGCSMVLLSLALIGYAQPAPFMTNYGSLVDDKGFSGILAPNGEYVLTGYSLGFNQFPILSEDIYFNRLDPSGNILPVSKDIATQDDEKAYFIDPSYTADGNHEGYIMTGYIRPGPGLPEDLLLVKTDIVGNVLASLSFGNIEYQEIGYCVRQDEDLNYVAVGYLFDGFGKYIFVVKATNNLIPMWSNIYPVFDGTNIFDDEGRALVMANNIAIPGMPPMSQAYALTGKIKNDAFVMLLDKMGNHLVSTRVKPFAGSQDIGHSIQQDYDGGLIIAGSTIPNPSTLNLEYVFVHKATMGAMPVWLNVYDFPLSQREHARFIQLDGNGYVLTGRAYQPGGLMLPPGDFGKAFLMKLDPTAVPMFANTYLDPTLDGSHGNRIELTPNGYFISGYTWINEEVDPPFVVPVYDYLALSTDMAGTFLSAGTMCFTPEPLEFFPTDFPFEFNVVDPANFEEVYEPPLISVDVIEPQCHCWSCPTPVNITSVPGGPGSGVIQLSWTKYPCHLRFNGKGRKVGTIPFGGFVTMNNFKNVGGLNSGTLYEWKLRAQCLNLKISPYSSLMTFVAPTMIPKTMEEGLTEMSLYPNPANASAELQYLFAGDGVLSLQIFDYEGRLLEEMPLDVLSGTVSINTSTLSPGLYLVELLNNGKVIQTVKMTVVH